MKEVKVGWRKVGLAGPPSELRKAKSLRDSGLVVVHCDNCGRLAYRKIRKSRGGKLQAIEWWHVRGERAVCDPEELLKESARRSYGKKSFGRKVLAAPGVEWSGAVGIGL